MSDFISGRAGKIDDVVSYDLGLDKMMRTLDEISASPQFRNPEDINNNLIDKFNNLGQVDKQGSKNLIKEYEEGLYWITNGNNDVIVSKKWNGNTDEIDVVVPNKGAIIECKNSSGMDVRGNVNEIILKFSKPSKLSDAIKLQFPNHWGKVSISNINNPIYNLNKQQLINLFRDTLLDLPGGIDKAKFKQYVHKVYFENGTGRFFIDSTEW